MIFEQFEKEIYMELFDSIFGIDITGDGKADMIDDAIILGALEEEEQIITEYGDGDEPGNRTDS